MSEREQNRKAANVIAEGKRPIDEDGFIKIVQTIAARIKRLPVQ